jgi:hypothetical protein
VITFSGVAELLLIFRLILGGLLLLYVLFELLSQKALLRNSNTITKTKVGILYYADVERIEAVRA